MPDMQPNQLPLWIQYIQAIGPSFVAVIAALIAGYIALRQWKTAHTRVKLDLFHERFAIFEVLGEINRAWSSSKADEWVAEYLSKMREATERLHKFRLLFPRNIERHVDELIDTWHDFVTAKAEGEGINKPSQEWTDHVRKLRQLWDKIGQMNEIIRKEIEDFIRLDWKV
jgi:hypothetical protein